jgi:hypothetical protein
MTFGFFVGAAVHKYKPKACTNELNFNLRTSLSETLFGQESNAAEGLGIDNPGYELCSSC